MLACTRALGLPDDADFVNPNGGAIALGHPLGASGARLCTTALSSCGGAAARRAVVSLCVGVGQGLALSLERPSCSRGTNAPRSLASGWRPRWSWATSSGPASTCCRPPSPRFGADNLPGWLFTASGALLLAVVFAELSRAFPARRRTVRLHARGVR